VTLYGDDKIHLKVHPTRPFSMIIYKNPGIISNWESVIENVTNSLKIVAGLSINGFIMSVSQDSIRLDFRVMSMMNLLMNIGCEMLIDIDDEDILDGLNFGFGYKRIRLMDVTPEILTIGSSIKIIDTLVGLKKQRDIILKSFPRLIVYNKSTYIKQRMNIILHRNDDYEVTWDNKTTNRLFLTPNKSMDVEDILNITEGVPKITWMRTSKTDKFSRQFVEILCDPESIIRALYHIGFKVKRSQMIIHLPDETKLGYYEYVRLSKIGHINNEFAFRF
jgi:hypothetical protein